MANHPSAEKRNRQRIRRTEQKRAQRSSVRTSVKQAREALRAGNAKAAGSLVALAEKALARAAQKGVVTKKSSARITSRLASAFAKLAPAPKAAAKR
jgi:small subunit ribosomal protein S20